MRQHISFVNITILIALCQFTKHLMIATDDMET